MTYEEKRIEILQARLKSRTRNGGVPRPGFEQNVASIRAEIESLALRQASKEDLTDGN